MAARRLAAALGVLAVVGAVLLAFLPVLGPDEGLFFRDHGLAYRPRWWSIREAILDGRLPALTRASRGDVPLEALLNGAYTPLTLLLFLGPFDLTYDFLVAGAYGVLGTGAFVLIRDFGARPHEAAAGAAVAALSGPVLSLENLLAMTLGLVWTPWIWWAFRRLLFSRGRATWGWSGALALFTGFQLQSLVPPVAWLDLIGAGLIAGHGRRAINLRSVGAGCVAALLAFGVAAPDLVPTLDLVRQTRRAAGLGYLERSVWAVEPRELIELLIPAFWWAPENGVYTTRGAGGAFEVPFLASLYLGTALPLALGTGLAALRRPRRPWEVALLGLFVLAVLASLGRETPVHRALSSLPLLAQSRYPPKFLPWACFAAAALVPIALRRLRRDRWIQLATVSIWLAGVVALAAYASTESFAGWMRAHVSPRATVFPIRGLASDDLAALAVQSMWPRLGHVFIMALLLVGLVALRSAPRLGRRRSLSIALAGVPCFDLALAGWFAVVGAPVETARLPSSIADAMASVPDAGFAFMPGWHPLPAVAIRPGETSLLAASMRAREERGGFPYRDDLHRHGDADAEGFSHPLSTAGQRLFGREQSLRLAARLGIDWISSFEPLPGVETLRLELPGEAPQAFDRVPEELRIDRVSVWTRWYELPRSSSPSQIRERVDADPAPGLPVLLRDVSEPRKQSCAGTATATLAIDALERVVADVASPCPALIRLQQVGHAGWEARVDGRPAPIETVDFGVIGVVAPSGRHTVEIAYASRAQRFFGFWVASVVAALALVAWGRTGPRSDTHSRFAFPDPPGKSRRPP